MREIAKMAWPTPILTPMLLAGCSDIQTSTWEVELSADPTPHLVELWRETEDSKPTRVFAYSVEFPQSYYYFRDNHQHLKQTSIGLLFDRQTLRPLAPAIVEEAARPEAQSNFVRPERLLFDRYRTRSLLVTITGLRGEQRLRRPSSPLEPLPDSPDFLWESRPSPGDPASGGTTLSGYSLGDPLVRVSCPSIDGQCAVETQYLTSRVRFALPKADLAQAVPVSRRLTELLTRHTKRQGG